jgi:uncharacterized repeat protein (TIGR03803 family)
VVGRTIYGTARYGGQGGTGAGTIFKVNTDGSGYSDIHVFSTTDPGRIPIGALTLSGTTLYGTSIDGDIFRINTDGSGFADIFQLPSGLNMQNGVTIAGSTLFGLTINGGVNNYGTVFKVNTDGSDYAPLHVFSGTVSDGNYPSTELDLIGSSLYGATEYGGSSGHGTLYKLNADGSSFAVLHSFPIVGPPVYGDLAPFGSILYGTAGGQIFQMNTDGSNFKTLHDFSYMTEGTGSGGVILSGSSLYGANESYGPLGGGTLFAFTVAEPSANILAGLGLGIACFLLRRKGFGKTVHRSTNKRVPVSSAK